MLDHVGLTYPDLDTHVPRLRREGVKILEDIHPWGDTRAAMIEDLDGLAIMLVERKEPRRSRATPARSRAARSPLTPQLLNSSHLIGALERDMRRWTIGMPPVRTEGTQP